MDEKGTQKSKMEPKRSKIKAYRVQNGAPKNQKIEKSEIKSTGSTKMGPTGSKMEPKAPLWYPR